MKIARLITPDLILISRNTIIVDDDYDFDSNLRIEVLLPSAFETFMLRDDIEYGAFRNILMAKCIPIWGDLSYDEKAICVKYFKYPADFSNEEYLTYGTMDLHKANWRQMIYRTTGRYIIQDSVRGRRLVEMVVEITWSLTISQITSIAASSGTYLSSYAILNFPHLALWLSNGTYAPMGIDYTTNGFAQKEGYSTDLKNKLLNILNNGI